MLHHQLEPFGPFHTGELFGRYPGPFECYETMVGTFILYCTSTASELLETEVHNDTDWSKMFVEAIVSALNTNRPITSRAATDQLELRW